MTPSDLPPRDNDADTGVDGDALPHASRVTELFQAHNAALIGFLQSKLDSLAEAQDVAQEAYVRLLRLENPEQVSFLRAYLFQIATNLAIDRLRGRTVRKQAPVQDLFEQWLETPQPDRFALGTERLRVLRQALRELPPKCSRAFVMHFIENRGFDEIAAHMKLSERMVRYHVARALAHCRARIDMEEN
ncbi:MAG: RNA polymerase sigma factor [Thermomonas sp.]|uniref:RNA polymerase sigma factor n=1 Tax=Thermomonas sp. TaxID=1971895 RepID=UPI0039E6C51A